MELVLGVDLGTSYFKLGLFTPQGRLCGLGRVKVPKRTDDSNRCELSVELFWATLKEGLVQALEQAQATPKDIQAVSYSSQANSFLLLDANDQPITPLVLWPDLRAKELEPKLSQFWARADFLSTTGKGVMGPESYAAKLLWFQKEAPDLWARSARVMSISDYFTFGLTGQYVGDQGTASLLGIWDLPNGRYWPEALEILSLTPEQLSQPLSPATVAGSVTSVGAKLLGLLQEIPLAVGSLDHHMAAIGAGVGEIADCSESTGTVMACLNYQPTYQPRKDCVMGPAHLGKGFYQLAFDGDGTGTLDWYKNSYAPNYTYDELSQQAQSISPGADGLIAKSHAQSYPELTGFENVSDRHHHGHFVRAIMEQKARLLKKLVDQLCDSKPPDRIIATGGGARSDVWLKIKSEIIGVEFVTTSCEEPACRGAATFASMSI
jgi:xylulokinase